ncbi:glycosyltransferase [Paenarthrobacter sp. NyZ202]|uniref:glycosyltransferase n=1 Tax=Paenarthrobacter sp. NyZ202 TaxID=3402689 RepID=UPI003CEA607F
MTGRAIEHAAVVLPAHNEEQHLGPALTALQRAADALPHHCPDVTVSITVVLDSCTDGSAAIAAAFAAADPRLGMVAVDVRSTGESRAAGIGAALETLRHERAAVWLANTDADSIVPEDWLVGHVRMADSGVDAILGSVEPNAQDLEPALLHRWLELHPFHEDHPHIHGANFGVRASSYLAVGGFPRLRAHEDRVLAELLRREGHRVRATDTLRIITSGRTHARAPQGFAAYLHALSQELPAASAL